MPDSSPKEAATFDHSQRTTPYWSPGFGPCRCDHCDRLLRSISPAVALPGKPEGATWTEQDEREARTHDAFLNLANSKPRKRDDRRFHAMALQILCRAFKDGADVVYYEWLAWYKPEGWFTAERAFGAFLYTKLEPERAEILRLRAELAVAASEIASRHRLQRWNIEEGCDSLRVCKGDHERSAGCDFEDYVLRSRLSSPSAPDTRSPSGTGPSAQDWKTLYELEVRSTERRERTDALMAKLDLGDCGLEQGVERQCGHLLEAEEAGEAETL